MSCILTFHCAAAAEPAGLWQREGMPFVVILIACVAGLASAVPVLVFCGGVVFSVARRVQNEIAA